MDSQTDTHANYPYRALRQQALGDDRIQDEDKERAAGERTLQQPNRPIDRKGRVDLLAVEEVAVDRRGLRILLEKDVGAAHLQKQDG